jgi:hypothetical protein
MRPRRQRALSFFGLSSGSLGRRRIPEGLIRALEAGLNANYALPVKDNAAATESAAAEAMTARRTHSGPPIEELDLVVLTVDLPSHSLFKGQVGTVVAPVSDNTFEVEFADDQWQTFGLLTLDASQIIKLHFEQIKAA